MPLKTWLRLTLVLFLIGGGSVELISVAQASSQVAEFGPTTLVLFVLMSLFAAIQVITGLLLTHSPASTWLLRVTVALQIPWITSPILSYRVMGGIGTWIIASSGPLSDAGQLIGPMYQRIQFGGYESLGFEQSLPWSLGINLVALILFLFLPPVVRNKRATDPRSEAEDAFWDSLPKPPAT